MLYYYTKDSLNKGETVLKILSKALIISIISLIISFLLGGIAIPGILSLILLDYVLNKIWPLKENTEGKKFFIKGYKRDILFIIFCAVFAIIIIKFYVYYDELDIYQDAKVTSNFGGFEFGFYNERLFEQNGKILINLENHDYFGNGTYKHRDCMARFTNYISIGDGEMNDIGEEPRSFPPNIVLNINELEISNKANQCNVEYFKKVVGPCGWLIIIANCPSLKSSEQFNYKIDMNSSFETAGENIGKKHGTIYIEGKNYRFNIIRKIKTFLSESPFEKYKPIKENKLEIKNNLNDFNNLNNFK